MADVVIYCALDTAQARGFVYDPEVALFDLVQYRQAQNIW